MIKSLKNQIIMIMKRFS